MAPAKSTTFLSPRPPSTSLKDGGPTMSIVVVTTR